MKSASRGATTSSGTMVRNAMLAASSRRVLIGCATWTTSSPASVLNMRQSPVEVLTVLKPSWAYCGSGSRGCETKRWTPLRSQICTTSASLPTASPPGVPLSGTPISEAAICRS